jgi:uncharacterized repeat protein (TIGR04052 family)
MKSIVPTFLAVILFAAAASAQGGLDPNGQCIGDADGNNFVSIDELIAAVGNSLEGCPQRAVTLRFAARVGEQAFACGDAYEGIGTTSAELIPADFRFFVSDVRLVRPDGTDVPLALDETYEPWQLVMDGDGDGTPSSVTLLDFEDGSGPCREFGNSAMNDVVLGTVPPGVYTGVRFTMGVPFELNHGNQATAPDPLSLASMFWTWNGGYKFIRIDSFNLDGEEFRVHLGSTGCMGDPPVTPVTSCLRPNRARVELNDFDPDTNVVVVDLAELLADSDIESNTPDTAPGCMGESTDPECGPVFDNLGLNREDGTSDPTKQKFFRTE